MKICVAILLAGATLTLAGCASNSSFARSDRYARVTHQDDTAYIAAVEAAAQRRGVDVYWIHPPKKAVPVDQKR